MDEEGLGIKRGRRGRYSKDYKERVVAQCEQEGVSIASVALSHGLNANLVHKWIAQARQESKALASPSFVPVGFPVQSQERGIAVSLRRGDVQIEVRWPVVDAPVCAAWIKELLR